MLPGTEHLCIEGSASPGICIHGEGHLRASDFSHYAFGMVITAALLVGCGGSQSLVGAPAAMSPAQASHAARSGSLLYVLGKHHIYVLSYPKGSFIALIKYSGTAECSDNRGNVFVTSSGAVSVFSHGGIKPIRNLYTGANTYGCSVDPTTGDLAVTDLSGVLIFKKARGKGEQINASTFNPRYCGYNTLGNLFVDGYYFSKFVLAELPKGSTNFKPISLHSNSSSIIGGQVQWDGRHITVEDNGEVDSAEVYRLRISELRGKIVGNTKFTAPFMVPALSWIQGDALIVPYSGSDTNDVAVGLWDYPAGGNATKTITNGFGKASGGLLAATVSVAPHR